jgi:hypothetical protein
MAAQGNKKKLLDLKLSFYVKKFGVGLYLEKMPMIFPYKYQLSLQIAWLEICLILIIKKRSSYANQ